MDFHHKMTAMNRQQMLLKVQQTNSYNDLKPSAMDQFAARLKARHADQKRFSDLFANRVSDHDATKRYRPGLNPPF